jgi:hypothetical protein
MRYLSENVSHQTAFSFFVFFFAPFVLSPMDHADSGLWLMYAEQRCEGLFLSHDLLLCLFDLFPLCSYRAPFQLGI